MEVKKTHPVSSCYEKIDDTRLTVTLRSTIVRGTWKKHTSGTHGPIYMKLLLFPVYLHFNVTLLSKHFPHYTPVWLFIKVPPKIMFLGNLCSELCKSCFIPFEFTWASDSWCLLLLSLSIYFARCSALPFMSHSFCSAKCSALAVSISSILLFICLSWYLIHIF